MVLRLSVIEDVVLCSGYGQGCAGSEVPQAQKVEHELLGNPLAMIEPSLAIGQHLAVLRFDGVDKGCGQAL